MKSVSDSGEGILAFPRSSSDPCPPTLRQVASAIGGEVGHVEQVLAQKVGILFVVSHYAASMSEYLAQQGLANCGEVDQVDRYAQVFGKVGNQRTFCYWGKRRRAYHGKVQVAV